MGKVDPVNLVDEIKKLISEGFSSSPWRSLTACLPGVKFEAQGSHETVLLLMRKHPVTNLWWLILTAMLLGTPLFWDDFPLVSNVDLVTRSALAILWYLGLAFFVIQNLLLWFYSVYIVTDERIVDVDFFGLLYKNVNVAQIRKIEDVSYAQIGILSSVFDYGNVIIETAGEQRTEDRGYELSAFTFEAVPNPDRVVKVINQLMEQEEQESYEGRVR